MWNLCGIGNSKTESNARHKGRARRVSADARLGRLQICSCVFAALVHHIVRNALSLIQGAHSGALDSADVHENVASAALRLNESEALLIVEPLHGACRHKVSF